MVHAFFLVNLLLFFAV